MIPPIILEDEDFLIVEKPAGISTQPLTRHWRSQMPSRSPVSECVASLLAKDFPEITTVGGADWGAVHRLDRETSGLVVFARNQRTYDRLREAFSKNEVEKEYLALVEGPVEGPGKIHWPIGPDPKSKRRVRVYRNVAEARRAKAQEAVTTYVPLTPPSAPLSHMNVGEGPGVRVSLLRVIIKTGRRHQIRAHLAAVGHPIVGDTGYGGPEADRLYLHASRLRFKHPGRGDSPSPSRWVEVLSAAPFSGSPPSAP